MKSSVFETTTHGKWILAGEHAVIRGCHALVFPLNTKVFHLKFEASGQYIRADFNGTNSNEIKLIFWGVLEHALETLKVPMQKIVGKFVIDNNIPLGVGLGASAAICVAVSRWLSWQNLIEDADINSFSQNLENLFHSKSSGVDILGVTSSEGMLFRDNNDIQSLQPKWQPHWILTYSGHRAITSDCVAKVMELINKDPNQGNSIDAIMQESVISCFEALQMPEKEGLPLLTYGINQANLCFTKWGLIDTSLHAHIQQILVKGALAAKPTGSGDGGYVLSLWDRQPINLEISYISLPI